MMAWTMHRNFAWHVRQKTKFTGETIMPKPTKTTAAPAPTVSTVPTASKEGIVVLDSFEFPTPKAFGIGPSYDWPMLFDGKIRKLKQGANFAARPDNFASTSRWVGAYKYHKIVKTHVEKDAAGKPTGVVVMQARDMTDGERKDHDDKVAARKAAKAAAKLAGKTLPPEEGEVVEEQEAAA